MRYTETNKTVSANAQYYDTSCRRIPFCRQKDSSETITKPGTSKNLNNETFYPKVISEGDSKETFDLIIFCVKNYHLENAIKDVKSFVGKNTILITFLNGITARYRIHKVFPDTKHSMD
jgi:ketopantoate reductase